MACPPIALLLMAFSAALKKSFEAGHVPLFGMLCSTALKIADCHAVCLKLCIFAGGTEPNLNLNSSPAIISVRIASAL